MTCKQLSLLPELEQEIIHGDCLEVMKTMEDNSIDFIVCDPPYGLNFMGKKWDDKVPNIDIWTEALRICKPGSMLAAFGGSRTHHHLMLALEKSGWEIRDVIMWLYGSGFPKSHNKFGLYGYGTSLKPAYEPIIIAMKPLEGTYKQNAEKWGVAGINIDESRIEYINENDKNSAIPQGKCTNKIGAMAGKSENENNRTEFEKPSLKGRWPSNLILSEESAEQLDQMTGNLHSAGYKREAKRQCEKTGLFSLAGDGNRFGDSGGPSRFFYCAKSSSAERNKGLEGNIWLDNLELVLYNGTSFTLEELWVLEGQNQNMNLDAEALQKKDISGDLMSVLEDKECCIISCGNSISEQFPKTIKFTMLMGLKQTIELKTWSFYQPLSISDCIQDVLKTNQGNGSNLAENVGLKNILKRIFTKEKTVSLLGVKNVAKKMLCLISVKEELRKGNIHPTCKPISLMKYILKLLAPPGNPICLDPFAGSGSTLLAAKELGIKSIGIEKEQEYCEIAKARLA